jgi:hypothetical protein
MEDGKSLQETDLVKFLLPTARLVTSVESSLNVLSSRLASGF